MTRRTQADDEKLAALRQAVARLEKGPAIRRASMALSAGHAEIDAAIPGGGLLAGVLHEVSGVAGDTEHGLLPACFVAACVGRTSGDVLWVCSGPAPFIPGLEAVGLPGQRIIFVEAGKEALLVMEEALRHGHLGAVVAEVRGAVSLVASRRIQLAVQEGGVQAFMLRTSRIFDDPALRTPAAAVTRWRIGPSPPALPLSAEVPGVGPAHWILDLWRVRGEAPRMWLVEAAGREGVLNQVSWSRTGDAAAHFVRLAG